MAGKEPSETKLEKTLKGGLPEERHGMTERLESGNGGVPDWLAPCLPRILHAGRRHDAVLDLVERISGRGPADRFFVAEGIGLCAQVLHRLGDTRIPALFLAPGKIVSPEAIMLATNLSLRAERVYILSSRVMEAVGKRDASQGIIALAPLHEVGADLLGREGRLVVVVLDGLESPGNIGTIYRSCDGAGVDAVLHCNRRVRETQPDLVKASTGAILDIPTLDMGNTFACAEWLVSNGFSILLADPHAPATDLEGCLAVKRRIALVAGNERYGISSDWKRYPSDGVSIPMRGRCDSLNVGVATSILLYGICGMVHGTKTKQVGENH